MQYPKILQFQAGHVCGDLNDLVNGVPTGSVRVSFGYMSRKKDADAVLKMIEDCFVQKPVIKKFPENWNELQTNYKNRFKQNRIKITSIEEKEKTDSKKENMNHIIRSFDTCEEKNVKGVLKSILLYPIKSCGPFVPSKSWKICSYGLEYDRKWMIVNSNGSCLSQKQNSNMCLIKPTINLEEKTLMLSFPGEIFFKLILGNFCAIYRVSLQELQLIF